MPRGSGVTAKATEQNFAQYQHAQGLPKRDRMPGEKRGHEPVPQLQHYKAENGDERQGKNCELENSRNSSHVASSLSLDEFVVDGFEPLAQMNHCVMLPREERFHAHTGRGRNLLKAVAFNFMCNKHRPLFLGELF